MRSYHQESSHSPLFSASDNSSETPTSGFVNHISLSPLRRTAAGDNRGDDDGNDGETKEKSREEAISRIALVNAPTEVSSLDATTESGRHTVLWLALRYTAPSVLAGVAIMLLGIGIVQAAILPRIFTCPSSATCPNSFDPNTTNVLQLLQTLMDYWFKIGLLVAGFGLTRLSAYQSWFILMMKEGNTLANLDLNLSAIRGSLLDSVRLVNRRGNRALSVFIILQIAIGAGTQLFIGLSIVRTPGKRTLAFNYPSVSTLPDSSLAGMNSDGQTKAIAKVVSWAVNNDTAHDSAWRGTLVPPDGRNAALNVQPAGHRIHGSINCTGVDSITPSGATSYTITLSGRNYSISTDMQLAVSETNVGTAHNHYLWASNSSGMLPNASATSDGKMSVTWCDHQIFMIDETPKTPPPGVQLLNPNVPVTPGCRSSDPYVCAADSVNNAILEWWGAGLGQSMWKVACRGGVLGPMKTGEVVCPLSQELWEETVSSMLDGIMQTAPMAGLAQQVLVTVVETISLRWWWLQSVIPLLVLVIYALGLAYTFHVSQGNAKFKELNLIEVIKAAQTDHVRDLVLTGQLKKSVINYDDSGFVRRR